MQDLISRQAAIDALKKISFSHWFECGEYLSEDTREIEIINSNKAFEAIEALPSAQPERKGKWIEMGTNKDGTHSIRCSKCGGGYKTRGHARSIATKAKYKFCPNCGADMRGEEDE